MSKSAQVAMEVWADWAELGGVTRIGTLHAAPTRGKEVFSFEYESAWLEAGLAQSLDPALGLFKGLQYAPSGTGNFGVFLDSSPDRWGRTLMRRREAQDARQQGRPERNLVESDFLLGVHDAHRMGALRFRLEPEGPFVSHDERVATPPWTSLRELESASLALEDEDAAQDPHYSRWLSLLIAPGSSLGGARPKASVVDPQGHPWIAKFPSRNDTVDVGAWEGVVHRLAVKAGLRTAEGQTRIFVGKRHTFLTRRFDRLSASRRLHFASAMTLLQRSDGADASMGASYLELAQFIVQQSAQAGRDLEELWLRIIFFISVSNADDHLRNHGFLLSAQGWTLAPAYDMNPVPTATGLTLNISETDNALDLELARQVAPYFRVKPARVRQLLSQVKRAVTTWRAEAKKLKISDGEQDRMSTAFRPA